MKLNRDFQMRSVCGLEVATAPDYEGIIQNNETSKFIFACLLNYTTEEAIVDAMFDEYDAPRDVIAADVHAIIEQLRSLGLIEE